MSFDDNPVNELVRSLLHPAPRRFADPAVPSAKNIPAPFAPVGVFDRSVLRKPAEPGPFRTAPGRLAIGANPSETPVVPVERTLRIGGSPAKIPSLTELVDRAAPGLIDNVSGVASRLRGMVPEGLFGGGLHTGLSFVDNDLRKEASKAAFRRMFDKEPKTPTDWATAEALNPNSYDPKYKGVGPEIRVARINPVPGQGVVRTAHWIENEDVWNAYTNELNLGDKRAADPHFDPEHAKVTMYVDYENGLVVMRQNPSVQPKPHSKDPDVVKVAVPEANVWQTQDGSVRIQYGARDGFNPDLGRTTGTVNGDIVIKPGHGAPGTPGSEGATINGTRTNFPSFEAYQDDPTGATHRLVLDPAGDHGLGPGTRIGPAVNLWAHHDLGSGPDAFKPFYYPIWDDSKVYVPGQMTRIDKPSTSLGTVDSPPKVAVYAAGGEVSGPGSSIGDMVPAWLSNGEFVVNAKAAAANRSLLRAINSDANAMAGLARPMVMPDRAFSQSSASADRVDESMTINISTPDIDNEFRRSRMRQSQDALTYTARWS